MLRNLFRTDILQLLAIENTVHISPWTEETFAVCLQLGYVGWVVEIEKKIIGFIIVASTTEEFHILNLGVLPAHQRQGFGQRLLTHALLYARHQGVDLAFLEVRCSNSRAIAMYQKLQFQEIGKRKNYYPTVNGYEDALIFALHLR